MYSQFLNSNPGQRAGATSPLASKTAPAAVMCGRRHASPELQRQAEIAYAAALEVLG